MSNIKINYEGIARLFNELDPSKSHEPGPDDIPARLLKLWLLKSLLVSNYFSLLPLTKAPYLKSDTTF